MILDKKVSIEEAILEHLAKELKETGKHTSLILLTPDQFSEFRLCLGQCLMRNEDWTEFYMWGLERIGGDENGGIYKKVRIRKE